MKILWVADKYMDVSVDSVTWTRTCREMMDLGHDVTLVTAFLKEKKPFGLEGHIRYLPSIKKSGLGYLTFTLSLAAYLWKAVFHDKPDIVLIHQFSFVSVLPLILLSRMKLIPVRFVMDIRTVPVEYNGIAGAVNNILFRAALKTADRLFHGFTVITPFMRDYLKRKYGLNRKAIGVWTSGVAVDHFNPEKSEKDKLSELCVSWDLDGKFVIMYHGVLTPNRGLFEAVDAMKIVGKTHKDIILLLIGKGSAREKLQERARELGLNGAVKVKGPVDHQDMPLYLSLSDIGILPFPALDWWRVSSPIKLMEYMAMKKPVIVTDIEAHRNVLADSGIGIYAETNAPEILARSIIDAYTRRKELKESGEKARVLAVNDYTWHAQAVRLADYLGSISAD